MIDLKLIAKGGLVVLIIVSLAVLIDQLTSPGSTWDDEVDDPEIKILPINSTLWPTIVDKDDSIYNEDFIMCLKEHVKNSYYPVTQGKNISMSCIPPGRCMHNFLIHSTKILASLDLRVILIEPSLLFCMLPSSRKYSLISRGFIATKVNVSRNIITVGLESSLVKILDEAKTRKRLASYRYKILRLPRKSNSVFTNGYISEEPASHYFLIHYDMILHIVVLYPKESYLLSASFNPLDMSVNGLQYLNDQAFENFTTSTTYFDSSSTAPVLLPVDSRSFLLDMMSSTFLKCNVSAVDAITSVKSETLIALKELKSVLASQMVIFWLWSRSLQGWYEKCDIHHYFDELRFSVAAKSVEGFNFSALFDKSPCEHIESYSDATNTISNIQLTCYDVKIHLILMYEDRITYWTEYMDDDNIYKLRFPKFTLCSTDIYGQKINVPCETGEILDSKYGQFLKNNTLSLHPESMQNVILLMEKK